MEILLGAIRKTRNTNLAIGIFLILFAPLFIYGAFIPLDTTTENTTGTKAFLIGIGVFFFLGGVIVLRKGIQLFNPQSTRVVKALTESPRDIVWVYEYTVVTRKFGIPLKKSTKMIFSYMDGKQESFNVAEKNRQPLMTYIQSQVPRAHFGYSLEIEKQFKSDPLTLVKG